ncbi:MAG: SMC-Scp complex subunit ScpB [Polyangiaceae bacterium]
MSRRKKADEADTTAPSPDIPTTVSPEEAPTRHDIPTLDADDADAEAGVEEARALPLLHLRGLIEALVFASDKPHKASELARLASAPVQQVKAMLAELSESYAGRGIVLSEVAGGWMFRTNAQYAPFVRELTTERPVRLTRAQVETLAIVAYRQPVTRPEIDDIRGVDSGATLKLLLERDLARILGKKDEPGRPLLYGTTSQFLSFFGLKSLRDLPTLREFTELSEDSQREADAELGEVRPEPASPGDTIAAPPMPEVTSETAAPGRDADESDEHEPRRPGDGDPEPGEGES